MSANQISRRKFAGVATASAVALAGGLAVAPKLEAVGPGESWKETVGQSEIREEAIKGVVGELSNQNLSTEAILRLWGRLRAERIRQFASSLESPVPAS